MKAPDLRTLYATAAMVAGVLLLGGVFAGWRQVSPIWAIVSFVLVYDFDAQAAWSSALLRMLYTVIGCGVALAGVMACRLHWVALPLSAGVAMVVCGWALGFRGPWRALLVSVVLVVGSSLDDPSHDVGFAVTRAIQVLAGSVVAVVFSLPARWIEGRGR